MFNNSINVTKTKNNLSLPIIKHQKITTYDVGNPIPDFGQTQKYGDVKSID